MTDVGRLALAVLDGGLFAPKRALELAEHIGPATDAAAQPELRHAMGADEHQTAPAALRAAKGGNHRE